MPLPTDGRLQSWFDAAAKTGAGAAVVSGHASWWVLALVALPFTIDRVSRLVERLSIIYAKGTPAQIQSKAIALQAVQDRPLSEDTRKAA